MPRIAQFLSFVLIIACCLQYGHAQTFPVLHFQKFYGKNGDDIPHCLTKSADGYILLGGSVHESNGQGACTNGWVVKVTEYGEMLWEREIGGAGCDEIRGLVATPDSGVIFSGVTGSFINHFEKGQGKLGADYFVGKLNKYGKIEWLKGMGGLDVDQAYDVIKGYGDNYLVAGSSNSQSFDVKTNLGMTNTWVVRLSEAGTVKSQYSYGGNRHDFSFSAFACENGDMLYAGFTDSEDIDGTERRTNGDGWVLRTDRYGKRKWQKIYSGKYEDYFNDIAEDRDGNIALVGTFESRKNARQFWFLKLNQSGAKMNEKIFGDSQDEFGAAITAMRSGGYMITGYSTYYDLKNPLIKGMDDLWVVRFDREGDIRWQQTYGGGGIERGVDVLEYEAGVFYVLGMKYNDFDLGGERDKKKDFWLLKITEQNCDNKDVQLSASLYNYTAVAKKPFKLRANVGNVTYESFNWDFGDGNSSTSKDPQHTYTEPGVYEVKCTVTVNENCSHTYTLSEWIMVW